jgi:hypothetical protein
MVPHLELYSIQKIVSVTRNFVKGNSGVCTPLSEGRNGFELNGAYTVTSTCWMVLTFPSAST